MIFTLSQLTGPIFAYPELSLFIIDWMLCSNFTVIKTKYEKINEGDTQSKILKY